MNKASLYFTLILLAHSLNLFSQQRCHSDERTEIFKKTDPHYYHSLQQPLNFNSGMLPMMMDDIITIPVHVIIVHPPGQAVGTGVNFPMDHIQSQIDVLNEDFRRLNGDASNTPPEFAAGDSEIEFCLASVDPDGNDTDGVTRYGTTQNLNTNEFAIKSATGWDRNNYLNVWVGPGLGGILGWAYLPTTGGLPNATLDGIVVASGTFGGPGYGTTNNYDLGRTATHEVGHYLGLRHVWRNGGCGLDDGFDDTPLQDDQNFGCPNHPSPSCSNSGDMFMNYMDYVNDDCMNAFSVEQGEYMRLILNTSRASLLDAANTYCNAGSVPLVIELVNATDILCFGENNGTITVNASGGSGGYTYSIDGEPFQTSNVFINVGPGPHIITAQDSGGSTVDIDVVINEPTLIVANVDTQTEVSCFGEQDGVAVISATGGTPAPGNIYQYGIDNGPLSPVNVFGNLAGGPHTVEIQDDNGCSIFIDLFIIEPAELISFPDEIFNASCNGTEDGIVSMVTVGGNPFYTYSIDQINFQPTPVFFDLAAGDYQVTTIDQNGCISETQVSITEPEVLELDITDQEGISCFGETDASIILEASGGTATYEYSIDGINYQLSPVFDNLDEGTYTISVLDANACFEGLEVTIDAPEELIGEIIVQEDAGCAGAAEGSMILSANGGAGSYVFTYDTQTANGDTVAFSNLPAGTHIVTITDANDCNSELTVEILENAAIELETTAIEDISCFGIDDGMIEVMGSGGSGVYQYNINGGTYDTENTFDNLGSGIYNIGVLDEAGCEGILEIELFEPEEIALAIDNIDNPDCFGDTNASVMLVANGGSGVYEFTLNNETNTTGLFDNLSTGGYIGIVMDENGCIQDITVNIEAPEEIELELVSSEPVECSGEANGSLSVEASGGTGVFEYNLDGEINASGSFANLNGGTYTVLATDANGCIQMLDVEIPEPEVLEVSLDYVIDVSCAGNASGAIQAIANGGSGMVEFTLNGVTNNTGLFEDLVEGNYTITANDENNCTNTISAEVASSDELEIADEALEPVSCFGSQDGMVQLVVSGGNGDFGFMLNGLMNTTGLFENLAPGVYTAIVTDGAACSGTYDFEIFEPELLQVTPGITEDVSCFNSTDGLIQLIATGGSGSYIFNDGNNSNTTGLFENLSPGSYEFTITDDNACSTQVNTEIGSPAAIEAEVQSTTAAGCDGEANGGFAIEASGGTGSFSYEVNGQVNTSGIFENLLAGNYPVSIIDANACEFITNVDVAESADIELSLVEVEDNNCFGLSEGSIQLTASGGSGTFTYTLGTETNTTGLFENLGSGDYTILVEDAEGCSNTTTQSIAEPEELTFSTIEIQDISCNGASDGMLTASASGGTGAIEFILDGQMSSMGIFENLNPGVYDLEIIDENNCNAVQSITITEPVLLNLELSNSQAVTCTGEENGILTVQASGGSGIYTYSLNNENNTNGQFENLAVGTYEISVVDENGCTNLINATVEAELEISSEIIAIQNIDCANSGNFGNIQINASGGSGSFEYTLNSETNTNGYFENLPAGLYEIMISDSNGCIGSQAFEITEGGDLEVAVDMVQTISCYNASDGSLQVSVQGNGPYEFELDGNLNTNGYFENLSAGTYQIVVTDASACASVSQYIVEEPLDIMIDYLELNDVSCFGMENGDIQVEASGGSNEFDYTLNGETNTNGTFENVMAGDYMLFVEDSNGCSTEIPVSIEQPDVLSNTVVENQALTCYGTNDGSVQLIAEGGSGTYTYTLGLDTNNDGIFQNLEGGIYTVLIADTNGCELLSEVTVEQPSALEAELVNIQSIGCGGNLTGAVEILAEGGTGSINYTLGAETNSIGVFDNLDVGNYTVEIEDANGCTASIDFAINQTDDLEAAVMSNTPATCFGADDGTVVIDVLNGNGDYIYSLGTQTNTDGLFSGLTAGDYIASITDGSGCNTSLNFSVSQPNQIFTEAFTIAALSCFGANDGIIQIEAFGGVAPYVYSFNNEVNTNGGFENVAAGNYQALVTDANACTQTMLVEIIEPDAIQAELIAQQSPDCYGESNGFVELEAIGGSAPFEYSLDGQISSNGIFENLSAGNYDLMITDANGCTSTEIISLDQPDALLSGVLDITPVQCYGGNDGVIFVGADGGTPTYQFELNGEVNSGGVFFNLSAGQYTVIVTDASACSSETVVVVSEPNELILEVEDIQNDSGMGDGSVDLATLGGIGPFMYSLDGIDYVPSSIFTNLAAGTYTAYVRDSNGCISEISFTIEISTSISNPEQGVMNIELFPNPFENELFIAFDLLNTQPINISVFNVQGQEIFRQYNEVAVGASQLKLNIPHDLPVGTYILALSNDRVYLGNYKLVKMGR